MTNLISDHGIELINIEPGSFIMGSDFDVIADIMQKIMFADIPWEQYIAAEWPQHQVEISSGFYISKYPVTDEIYQKVMPTTSVIKIENKPILLQWREVKTFLHRLNSLDTQFHFRLPTEAEWEYCAKTGNDCEFIYSDDLGNNEKFIVTGDDFAEISNFYKPVGSSGENDWEIYDMIGNVPEWCSDYYDPDYYLDSPDTDPENTTPTDTRVAKGSPSCSNTEEYKIPYRTSARIPITCSENDQQNEESEYYYEEYLQTAGLRLVAARK